MRIGIIGLILVGFLSCKDQDKKAEFFRNVDVETFQKMLNEQGAQLIDVRTPREYEKGHLEGAVLINYLSGDFKRKAFDKLDRSKPVLVYCAGGGRSLKAAKIYSDAGFTKVYNLMGGFRSWEAKKMKTTQ
tara:strand:+ start:215 stop:607 length:393 start_codon:yes stop_codon:yes gene_type:complete